MSQQPVRGISRHGLDAAFEAEEARKSELILAARLLREQGQDEAAADKFAAAAEIEEHLADVCDGKGLAEKSFVHRFSAASCWAQACNFYHAIALCDDLLSYTGVPDRLRRRVDDYAHTLRNRRAQWYAGLALEPTATET